MSGPRWYADGIRFECARSGACCHNHGEYDSVYFTRREERRLAEHLGLSLVALRRRFLKQQGGYRVARSRNRACIFLDGVRCAIYPVRPVPCRTWPFWPELMEKRSWRADVVPFCRGVGCGPRRPEREIERALRRKIAHDRELEEE